MQIQRSDFDAESIERFGSGAGIIPLARAPSGEYHMLLGRERFLPSWKGSCRWSDFGGGRKQGETLLQTAVREFSEESLGIVEDVAMLRRRLEDKDYWIRVVLRIHSDTGKRVERYHCTYVLEVPWCPSMVESFSIRRRDMETLDNIAKEMDRLFPEFAMVDGRDVELGSVCKAEERIMLFRHVSDSSDLPEESEEWAADSSGWQVLGLPHSHPYAHRIRLWEAMRTRAESMLVDHPCLRTKIGPISKRLQMLSVLPDYLEKDQVRWWSSLDLRRVLDQKGFLGNDCFRPYFLPVLQTVLHTLSEYSSGAAAEYASHSADSTSAASGAAAARDFISKPPSQCIPCL